MAFVTKTWKDRLVEFAGRRKLKNVSTNEEVLYDVSRSEGTVMQAGDSFSAANMNDLEQRIKKEFDNVSTSLGGLGFAQDENGKWGYKVGGADTVTPFKGDVKISFKVRVVMGDWQSNVVADNTYGPYYISVINGEISTTFTNVGSYRGNAGTGWTTFYITDIAIVEEE